MNPPLNTKVDSPGGHISLRVVERMYDRVPDGKSVQSPAYVNLPTKSLSSMTHNKNASNLSEIHTNIGAACQKSIA